MQRHALRLASFARNSRLVSPTSHPARCLATHASTSTTVQKNTPPPPVSQTSAFTESTTLPGFRFGAYPASGVQTKPIRQIRLPQFTSLEHEREFRKLHHAAALRWLGYSGYNNEGAGGHVTVRDPIKPDHFWINPHGVSFKHMKPEDLCLVSEEGEVVEGGNMHTVNPAGFAIHNALHQARPDVIAAVHCHSIPSKAFSALGCKLEPITQDACRFYEDHALYASFGGIVYAHEEGRRIAEALGDKKAVILANHGILTVAKTVDAAAFLFGAMDRCIEAQLMADAAAAGRGKPTVKIGHSEALWTRNVYNDEMTYIMFQSSFEDVVKASNGELSFHSVGEIPRTDDELPERRVGETKSSSEIRK